MRFEISLADLVSESIKNVLFSSNYRIPCFRDRWIDDTKYNYQTIKLSKTNQICEFPSREQFTRSLTGAIRSTRLQKAQRYVEPGHKTGSVVITVEHNNKM